MAITQLSFKREVFYCLIKAYIFQLRKQSPAKKEAIETL